MIKAVIFDLDGLILDSEILESRAFERLLKEYGKTPRVNPDGLIHDIRNAINYYENFKTKYNIEEETDVLRYKKRVYFEQLIKDGNLQPYEGLYALLKELKKKQLKIALASNRIIEHVQLVLKELEILDYFEVILGPNKNRRHKPHPDIYREVAKKLQIDPSNCLVLEDTDIGVVAAKTAEMNVIAIPNIYTNNHDFSKADKVVHSLQSVTIELINSL